MNAPTNSETGETAPHPSLVQGLELPASSVPEFEVSHVDSPVPGGQTATNSPSDLQTPAFEASSTSLVTEKQEKTNDSEHGPTELDEDKGQIPRFRRRTLLLLGAVLLFVILAIAIPVGVVCGHRSSTSNGSTASQMSSSSSSASASAAAGPMTVGASLVTLNGGMTGGNGSIIYPLNGSTNTFTYINNFGGHWSALPFDNSARAQDDVPSLNQTWDFGNYSYTIRGVNIGGWLTTEPFICSDIYERFINDTEPAIDEFTLSQKLDAISTTEKRTVLEEHYSNFITEEDFANIAGAGLNWVRIALPFWMIEVYPGEPYYTGQWPHFLNAIAWARKYGLRINLDFHALPGSQNGWDHSGRRTFNIDWMRSNMGLANGQRSLNYMRTLTEFASQTQYSPVIQMISIVNEIQVLTDQGYNGTSLEVAESFYGHAYSLLRNITGANNGPYIVLHEGFGGLSTWAGFLSGADRVALDTHTYLCFSPTQLTGPINSTYETACSHGPDMRTSMQDFGLTLAGEWSLAVNDCGFLLNGVGTAYGSRYDGTYLIGDDGYAPQYYGSCDPWNDWQSWTTDMKQDFQQLAFSWMDALQNSFFWTWKVRNTLNGTTPNPMWSYSLGLTNGWIPADIRSFAGTCNALQAGNAAPCNAQNCPVLPTSASVSIPPFPPTAMVSATTTYSYTATQTPITMSVSTPTAYPSGATATANPGSGWFNTKDTALFYTPVAGATYEDAWYGPYVPVTEYILRRAEPTVAVI